MNTSWIQTFSGKRFCLTDPTTDMICIEDIAHALSHLCRFTGHVRKHYSIAQHSLLVGSIAFEAVQSRHIARQAIMHDATEAYIGDVSTPLKHLLPDYKIIEQNIWRVIAERFDIDVDLYPEVKAADIRAMVTERRDLMGPSPHPWSEHIESIEPCTFNIRPWKARRAEAEFLHVAKNFKLK